MVFSERPLEDRRIGVLQSFFAKKKVVHMIRIMQDMTAMVNSFLQPFQATSMRFASCRSRRCAYGLPLALLARGLTMAVPESSPYDCWERARVDPVVLPEQFAQVRTVFGYGSLIFRPGFQYKRTGSLLLGWVWFFKPA